MLLIVFNVPPDRVNGRRVKIIGSRRSDHRKLERVPQRPQSGGRERIENSEPGLSPGSRLGSRVRGRRILFILFTRRGFFYAMNYYQQKLILQSMAFVPPSPFATVTPTHRFFTPPLPRFDFFSPRYISAKFLIARTLKSRLNCWIGL